MSDTATETETVRNKFIALQDAMNGDILERYSEIHTAVLSVLSRKHHFQIGPPGVAKSLLVDRLYKRIDGLGDEGYFRWLLTNYTTPEEIFGGPDFQLLRDRGIYKRITERKLPRAYVAFLDEIFKANSAILNATLTTMNERLFFNVDDDPHIPLISVFAASNELPHGEELWALWDRLHFRHEVSPLNETSSFMKLLSVPMTPVPDVILTLDDIVAAHKLVDAVEIPKEVIEAIRNLRDELRNEGVEPSERRWVEALPIIKAEAFMNGRDAADIEDCRPLMHVLWPVLDQQKVVKKRVLELANPIDRHASEVYDDLVGLILGFKKDIAGTDNTKDKARIAVEVFQKLQKVEVVLQDLIEQQEAAPARRSEYLEPAQAKFRELGEALVAEGFGRKTMKSINA